MWHMWRLATRQCPSCQVQPVATQAGRQLLPLTAAAPGWQAPSATDSYSAGWQTATAWSVCLEGAALQPLTPPRLLPACPQARTTCPADPAP
mmetsp:Transcript_33786/g.74853  ORF Transcript_33786/g.74853 Transcript_33786/m.74853 type:complete len:92 (+) Transcript_33786:382-657(+)